MDSDLNRTARFRFSFSGDEKIKNFLLTEENINSQIEYDYLRDYFHIPERLMGLRLNPKGIDVASQAIVDTMEKQLNQELTASEKSNLENLMPVVYIYSLSYYYDTFPVLHVWEIITTTAFESRSAWEKALGKPFQ